MKISKPIRNLIVSSVSLAVLSASPAFALCTNQALDLMKNLNGTWRGKGALKPIGGSPEFVSCRISYSLTGSNVINQTIACAGTDYKIEATSRVTCDGNHLQGTFEESAGHTTGRVTGDISGNQILIEADSPNFRGNFKVTFKSATDHLVAISQADHATGRQIPLASIQLSR